MSVRRKPAPTLTPTFTPEAAVVVAQVERADALRPLS